MLREFVLFLLIIPSMVAFSQSICNIDSLTRIGAINAMKKAHQMTDIPIVPVGTLHANKRKTYKAGEQYKGVIYSSAKETNTFVGPDVSIYTFMTALHNPRSVLYTERLDQPPYHGANCIAYYGTVCSGLINYALGFKITQRSADILVEDYFELIDDQSARGLQLADLVCRNGHPALVTGIERDKKGQINKIEVCASHRSGCKRRYYNSEEEFNKWLKKDNIQIYRYRDLYKNTSYTPFSEFVAVEGEELKTFKYNDDICANKGDKACYSTGEDVVLNVFGKGDRIEIYKDSKLYKEVPIHSNDTNVVLKSYPYGSYQARLVKGKAKSEYTKWIIVDTNVRIDKKEGRIYFSSQNAKPVYYEFCNIGGGRPTNKKRVYAAEFDEEAIRLGYVEVDAPAPPSKGKKGWPYVKVHFECDYGMCINKPINWFE